MPVHKGHKWSAEHNRKIGEANRRRKGKIKWSEEQKRRMSIIMKNRDYVPTKEIRQKIAPSKLNAKNPQWKGDNVGYNGIHRWIQRRLPKPVLCQMCNTKPPYDLANKSGHYLRNITDWEWLCRSCHMLSDGRFRNLKQFRE